MFYVMSNETNRLIGTSILGFDEVPDGCNVTEIDGNMPMLEGILGEYCIDESGNIKYDPDNYIEPDDGQVYERVTVNDLMDAILELADLFATNMGGE